MTERDQPEIIYGRRPDSLRIFVSSQMRSGALAAERRAVSDTINGSPMHHAWTWEDDAPAGAYHSEAECVLYAGTSDGLVLLLAGALTRVTRAEYEAARRAGADRFVFVRTGTALTDDASRFVDGERNNRTITRQFANISELRTSLTQALFHSAVRASRHDVLRRREAELGSSVPQTTSEDAK